MRQNATSFTTEIGKEWNLMSTDQKLQYKHDADLGKAVLAKAAKIQDEIHQEWSKPTPKAQNKPEV